MVFMSISSPVESNARSVNYEFEPSFEKECGVMLRMHGIPLPGAERLSQIECRIFREVVEQTKDAIPEVLDLVDRERHSHGKPVYRTDVLWKLFAAKVFFQCSFYSLRQRLNDEDKDLRDICGLDGRLVPVCDVLRNFRYLLVPHARTIAQAFDGVIVKQQP
jgi:hypothetical protein